MELNIFSYIYLPFGNSLLGNAFSSVLPIFLLNLKDYVLDISSLSVTYVANIFSPL